MARTKEHEPLGSTFESWLEEEGLLEEATQHAVKAVISWQLQKTMEERGLSKKSMAALMGTSRSQLDRLLDPESDAVTLKKPDARRPLGREKDQDRPRGCCLIQYFLAYDAASRAAGFSRSSRRVRAACRSAVSKPSVNQA